MTSGSRSKTGCLTCRLRKKKCDEQRPACQACCRSQLACYGYNVPVPAWIKDKSTWAEVRNSAEARDIRRLAENTYKTGRKIQSEAESVQAAERIVDGGRDSGSDGSESGIILNNWGSAPPLLAHLGITRMSNIWQLQPDTIWWDSRIGSLGVADGSSSQQETRLLMIFLQVVHEITHSFYKLSSNTDRSWLLNRIVKNRALYYAALSTSACFEHSLTQPATINEIGMCSQVRTLRRQCVHKLRTEVEAYSASENVYSQNLVLEGVRLIDVILNLLNLETFSMFGGSWEMHHQGARAILNHIERSQLSAKSTTTLSPITHVLRDLPQHDERRRTMEFCITNFVWIEVVVMATFGLSSSAPCAFDYIPLLRTGEIRPQYVMGCVILGTIAEITRLEQRCEALTTDASEPNAMSELVLRYQELANELGTELLRLEAIRSRSFVNDELGIERGITLISIVWIHAARLHLEVIASDAEIPGSNTNVLQTLVESCLRELERLPTRLVIRICWPYTISGCLSLNEAQRSRFREVLAKTLRERQAPGLVWKGLMVMEECWRLHTTEVNTKMRWREAMASLDTKVLLL